MKQAIFLLSLFSLSFTYAQLPVASSGHVEKIAGFKSKFVETRDIDVWLPANYSKEKRYAVLYVHDGQNLFDSTITYNREEWQLDENISVLLKNSQIKDVIVVGIYNTDNRWLEFIPQKPFSMMTAPWQDSVFHNMRMTKTKLRSDDYLRFIVQELKPYIDSAYNTYADMANTYTMGASIGGLIAFYAVCEYPGVFGGAACLSTHWPGGQLTNRKDNKLFAQSMIKYLKTNLAHPMDHRFYFDHGTINADKLYAPYQNAIDSTLKSKGYTSQNFLSLQYSGAEQTEKDLAKRLAGPLFFLLRK
jgi:enterochelin esterase-like enzyme